MNWDELNAAWRHQPASGRSLDVAALEPVFAAQQARSARRLFWRDVREAVGALFVAGVFANVGWHMGRDGWPLLVAIVLMLGLAAFFVAERVRARRDRPCSDAPLLVRLDAEIAEQTHQRRLLVGVTRWYLGPVFGAAGVFIGTVLYRAPLPLGAKFAAGGLMLAIVGLVGWGVVALNRFTVRRGIEPHLQELEQLRAELNGRS